MASYATCILALLQISAGLSLKLLIPSAPHVTAVPQSVSFNHSIDPATSLDTNGSSDDLNLENTSFYTSHALPPNLFQFQHKWRILQQQEMGRSAYKKYPSGLKIAMGVFHVAGNYFVRAIIRETWMRQPGVCSIHKDQTPGQECVFNVAFVIGNPKSECKLRETKGWQCKNPPKFYLDEIHFDFQENMNEGKTYRWFAFAADSFPWATHVGKMDVDFFPFLHGIADTIRPFPLQRFPYAYFGQPILSHGCSETGLITAHHWPACMYGAIYMLSYPLAKATTGKGSFWENAQFGNEDIVTGKAVSDFQWKTHKHVQVLPPRVPAVGNTGDPPLFSGVWGWHSLAAMTVPHPVVSPN